MGQRYLGFFSHVMIAGGKVVFNMCYGGIQDAVVSIKDVARLAKVSTATVSRVLNGKGGFSEKTRKIVMEAAKQCNYVPNKMAKALRTNKSNIVAVFLNDDVYDMYPLTIRSIQSVLQKQNYSTLLWNISLRDMDNPYSHISLLNEHNIAGVIYIPLHSMPTEDILNNIPESIPLVCLDRPPAPGFVRSNTAFIEPDNVRGGYMATKALLDRGCLNVGAIMINNQSMGNQSVFYGRTLGYQQALWETGIQADPAWIINVSDSNANIAYNELKERFYDHPELLNDGFFCSTDLIAFGLLRLLQDMGISVPEQVKVISFDDVPSFRDSGYSLSAVAQPFDEMGVLAAESVVKMIQGESLDFYHYLAPLKLNLRSTT